MAKKSTADGASRSTEQGKPGDPREDRLKAALKANMARRKAQARARGSQAGSDRPEQKNTQ